MIPTPEEVEKYLIGQEGQDVKVLELQGGGLAEVSHFVLVTGRSLRHLNNMSAGLVQVVSWISIAYPQSNLHHADH